MKPKNIVIKAEPIAVHISPFGFFHYGKNFFDVAKGFKQSSYYSPVPYFLYCHSIELILKAFLIGKGVSKKDLKKLYGHDLEKILNTAKNLGLITFVKITPGQEKEISKANKYYASKGFEYFEVTKAIKAYPALPDLTLLEKIASELVTCLESFCINAKGAP
ncbi:MAG: hypothetical protein ABFR82_15895 [Nitrospirota bacterium]